MHSKRKKHRAGFRKNAVSKRVNVKAFLRGGPKRGNGPTSAGGGGAMAQEGLLLFSRKRFCFICHTNRSREGMVKAKTPKWKLDPGERYSDWLNLFAHEFSS